MKPQDALGELLARVGAGRGTPIVVNDEELCQWPAAAVAAMKSHKLLMKARPAASVVCSGCERECVMAVHTVSNAARTASFVVCDKRSDINRVPVLIERLTQWRCTTDAVSGFVAASLGLRCTDKRHPATADLLEIGMATGDKRSQMLCLQKDGDLMLVAGGNKVPLVDTITYDKDAYSVDGSMIRLLVDAGTSADGPLLNAAENPCDVFLAMENLDASELAIAFGGDKSETGLGANNMLEICARKETRRVALATLELVDRRGGSVNSQGVVLLGMANRKNLPHSGANAAKMKRLRDVFREHLGIRADPFEPYRKSAGWVPRFKLADKRGAADERAKREAERRTDSYEQLNERGDRFADFGQSHQSVDDESEPGAQWLKNNDPDSPA